MKKPKVTIKSVVTCLGAVIYDAVETTGDVSLRWYPHTQMTLGQPGKKYDLNLCKCEYDRNTNTVTLDWTAREVEG